jgi:hypothetical protein
MINAGFARVYRGNSLVPTFAATLGVCTCSIELRQAAHVFLGRQLQCAAGLHPGLQALSYLLV